MKILKSEEIITGAKPVYEMELGAVYFLIDVNEVVYIGKSANYVSRIQQHLTEKIPQDVNGKIIYFPKSFTHYNIIPLECDEQRSILEAYYILKLKPKYNRQLPSNYLQAEILKNLLPIIESDGIKCIGNERCICLECSTDSFIYGKDCLIDKFKE